MKLGKIKDGEKTTRMDADVHCTKCNKKIPGKIKVSEKYSGTDEFKQELDTFRKNYLCGVCRDKKRVNKL